MRAPRYLSVLLCLAAAVPAAALTAAPTATAHDRAVSARITPPEPEVTSNTASTSVNKGRRPSSAVATSSVSTAMLARHNRGYLFHKVGANTCSNGNPARCTVRMSRNGRYVGSASLVVRGSEETSTIIGATFPAGT